MRVISEWWSCQIFTLSIDKDVGLSHYRLLKKSFQSCKFLQVKRDEFLLKKSWISSFSFVTLKVLGYVYFCLKSSKFDKAKMFLSKRSFAAKFLSTLTFLTIYAWNTCTSKTISKVKRYLWFLIWQLAPLNLSRDFPMNTLIHRNQYLWEC